MSIIATATLDGTDRAESSEGPLSEGQLVEIGEHERELFGAIADALGGRLVGWDPVRVAAISAAQGSAASLFHPELLERLMRAGVDSDDAERVTLALDVARRIAAWWPADRTRVQSPADLAAITLPVFGRATKEELHVAIVDGRNGLLALRRVYVGTATGTSVRIGELLRPVLDHGGVGFALVHNHPSGDPEPSDEDLRLTAEVLAAARLLDVEFLDHLVLGHGRWASIRTLRGSIWGAEREGA
ncbi:MAG: JAB domain-containing protein [Candidatus Limnocylindrus sp.]